MRISKILNRRREEKIFTVAVNSPNILRAYSMPTSVHTRGVITKLCLGTGDKIVGDGNRISNVKNLVCHLTSQPALNPHVLILVNVLALKNLKTPESALTFPFLWTFPPLGQVV